MSMATTTSPFDDLPEIEYALPGSIYTSALLIVLGGSIEEYYDFPNAILTYMIVLPQWLLLLFNFVIQVGFIYYIHEDSKDSNSCNHDTNVSVHLRYLAVGLFVAGMLQEFCETLDMLLWTWHVKTEATHQKLLLATRDGSEPKLATGLTSRQKLVFCLFMLMPKLAIAMWLFIVGGKFVAFSESNTDMVLNCLAMVFVTEIDDLLYKTFTPTFCRNVMENLPPVKIQSSLHGVASLVIVPWLKGVLFGGLSYMVLCIYECN